MYFDNFSDFVQMGSHGSYVWSAYGVTAVVLLASLGYPIKRRRNLAKEYARRVKRESTITQNTKTEHSKNNIQKESESV
ncbi:MAG: heme exporter protein CcmD [Pseudomonadales bacterium]|nr:heme exporter protein CcmD [Pseudomonadales bacterium]